MSQRQAAWTSVGEYLQRREAYERKQQLEWERSRWMTYNIISPFLGKNKPRTPNQWVKFPWEIAAPIKMVEIAESEIKTLNEIFNDFTSRKSNYEWER